MTVAPIDFRGRVERVAKQLSALGMDAYVGTRQAGLHYLNGAFMPWRGAVIVTANGECDFVYWMMDSERARVEGAGFDIHDFGGGDFIGKIAGVLEHRQLARGRIGLDLHHPGAAQIAPGMLTAAEYIALQDRLPAAKFSNGVDALDEVMLIKTPDEIERLRRAAAVSDVGIKAGLDAIRVGATENEVAGAIEQAMRVRGSTWNWAITGGTEVGAGERTAFLRGVTQQATDRKIAANEFVILDVHPMIDLYLADTALPVFFGTPNSAQQKLIDCWEETVATIFNALRPGRPVAECVREAVAVFAKYGMQDYGLPLFGHGLGTCARTRPFINLASTDAVRPGMVAALGTHLYVPGVGGARLEYPILINEKGAEALCATPAKVLRVPVR